MEGNKSFTTMRQVRDHLEGLGFQGCSVPQLYKHTQEGRLKRPPLPEAELMSFALTWLRQKPQGSAGDEKTAAEARRLQAQAELAETRSAMLRGQLVERGDFERALAARAILFRQDLTNFAHAEAAELTRLAGGSELKIPDVVAALLDKFEIFLSRYAADAEFAIPRPATIQEGSV
jgi:hypothetical protein